MIWLLYCLGADLGDQLETFRSAADFEFFRPELNAVCLERFPIFCPAGAPRSYASSFVEEARAFLVPEFSASEHRTSCSDSAVSEDLRRSAQGKAPQIEASGS